MNNLIHADLDSLPDDAWQCHLLSPINGAVEGSLTSKAGHTGCSLVAAVRHDDLHLVSSTVG